MGSNLIELIVNGRQREFMAHPGTSLLMALREALGLTAAKRGCADGGCGACTVLLDGKPVQSCLVPVDTIAGSAVGTLEGLNRDDGALTEVQAAFIDGFATQCGFCTAGMIIAAEALLAENPDPTRDDVVRAVSGNVCRCTGYAPIIGAVLDAAARRRQAATSAAAPARAEKH
jgi:aerobic carbon-monoxide dehydrogenase small subunit